MTTKTAGKPRATRRPAAPKAEAKEPSAKEDGAKLYAELVARAKTIAEVEVLEHRAGQYARLRKTGETRTCAYIVRGKTVATVYPNALAEHAPKGLAFRQVVLGAHHYGRGEIIVDVKGPDDVANAVDALKASLVMPEPPRAARAES